MTERFVSALHAVGATVTMDEDGSILASGMTSAQIGDLATDRALTVHELTPVRGSLEDAFMELTRDSVEFKTKPNANVTSPSTPIHAMAGARAGHRAASTRTRTRTRTRRSRVAVK